MPHFNKMPKTMILVLFLCPLLLNVSQARPQRSDKESRILHEEFTQEDPRSYQYKFETSNGISQAEIGAFEETGYETGITIKRGYYSYLGPDDVRYTVTYVADENGFVPKLHKSKGQQIHLDEFKSSVAVDGIDDDRIGTNLLISLGGGGIG